MAIVELSEQLANQIAAGEVIERPSSVVKELVENAIDAGSTMIEVFVEESGTKKIEVIDNGSGIEEDEVETAFLRHATSKIKSPRDLFHIKTLGFRGEALPSIASVSKVTLQTATQHAKHGISYTVEGGTAMSKGVAPLRQGTKVTVEHLFYNTPARMKYLKSLQTEMSHITQLMQVFSLSHPEIRFRLVSQSKVVFETYGTGQPSEILNTLYRHALKGKLFEVKNEDDDFQIQACLTLPEENRASNDHLTLVLNGRAIKNLALRKAIIQGYGTKLMVGRYPIGVVYIQMDPTLVDVNVHPTKQEVRLSKEEQLVQLIQETIEKALANERLIPKVTAKEPQTDKMIQESSFEETAPNMKKTDKTQIIQTRFSLQDAMEQMSDVSTGVIPEVNVPQGMGDKNHSSVSEGDTVFEIINQDLMEEQKSDEIKSQESSDQTYQKQFPELEYFGQMHGTYLFAQNEEGLFIIDQHAAKERINYEKYRREIGEVHPHQQELLIPLDFSFTPAEDHKLQDKQSFLEALGIHLEKFGEHTYILRSHPSWMDHNVKTTIQEMIDQLLQDQTVTIAKFREDTAIMMSCKRAVKANHYLSDEEARQLIDDLGKCQNPYNCPHGRPVMVEVTNYEIERMFKRIQDPH